MAEPAPITLDITTRMLELHDVKDRLKDLTARRNLLIKEIITAQGGKGVRSLSRFTGLSVAQVSRTWRREENQNGRP